MSIILVSLTTILISSILKPQFYNLHVKTGGTIYDYADGILVKSLWKSAIYLNVNFDDPNENCTVGLFLKTGDYFKTLEAYSGSSDDGCKR